MSNIKINDVAQRIQYTATSLQTVFPVPFPFFDNAEVVVYQNSSIINQGAAPGEYGITGAGSPSGGSITLVTGAPLNDIITILGVLPIDRTSIYSATISQLTGSDLNGDFNREVVMMKQIETEQSLLQLQYYPYAQVSQDPTVTIDRWIPVLAASEGWRMNAAGTAIEAYALPDGGIAPADATYITQTPNAELTNEQALSSLASGFMTSVNGVGVLVSRVIQGITNQIVMQNGDGVGTNPTVHLATNLIMPGTFGFQPPQGTSAGRPAPSGTNIYFRYNTTINNLEFHNGTAWVQLSESDPDGPDGSIQYNNSGAFLGSANFTTDGSNVAITGDLDVDNINVNGNTITSTDAAGDINITPDTTGDLVLDGLKWPQADGTANQFVQTDALGQLSFGDGITPATLQNNTYVYDVDTGAADAYVVTLSPAPSAYADGLYCIMKALNNNTGASTININGLGVIPLQLQNAVPLLEQQILAGGIYWVIINSGGTAAELINPNIVAEATKNFWNGLIITPSTQTITSDGVTITFALEKTGGGDLTALISTGQYTLDTSPAKTVTLTAGTDTVPVNNYIYILASNPQVLVADTSEHDGSAEIIALAIVSCQSAASLQADEPYMTHRWTDCTQNTVSQGHLVHLNWWVRHQPATWESGIVLTPTVGVSTFDIATTAGAVMQLHHHTYPIFNTGTGSDIYVVNDFATAYDKITDMATILTDANGVSMSNTRFNLVIWGIVSETETECKIFCNVPTDSYNSDAEAISDVDRTAVYNIPIQYRGTAFLISRLSIRHINSSATWSLLQNEDLRGLTPGVATGSGTGGIDALIDDPNPTLANDLDVAGFGFKDSTNANEYLFKASSTLQSKISVQEDTDNGTNTVSLAAPAAITASYDLIMPAAAPTVAGSSLLYSTAGVAAWTKGNDAYATWTVTIDFDTTGDLSMGYTAQIGNVVYVGEMAHAFFQVNFTPTFTTASGNLRVGGLPVNQIAGSRWSGTVAELNAGITWPAGRTTLSSLAAANTSYFNITCSGSGVANASLTTTAFVSGVAVSLRGVHVYRRA